MSFVYEFRIAGHVSDDLLLTFSPDRAHKDAADTVFVRTINDDGELFGLIARCETLSLHLIGLREVGNQHRSAE